MRKISEEELQHESSEDKPKPEKMDESNSPEQLKDSKPELEQEDDSGETQRYRSCTRHPVSLCKCLSVCIAFDESLVSNIEVTTV